MFKRVFIAAASAFLLGQLLVIGVQMMQGRNFFAFSESARRAEQYREVLQLVNKYYVRESDAAYDKLADTALESMLHSLDPHSDFMSSDEYRDFRVETSQAFGGIGVQVEMRDRRLTVVAPIAGTPGKEAGLLRGDQFIEVDGRSVEGLALDECLNLLRGPVGRSAHLVVYRPSTDETFERTIVRAIINVASVRDDHIVEDGIGYLRIVQFGGRTGAEFVEAIQRLEDQGMRGLVIDLRDNPGGLIDSAVAVVQPFLEPGDLVMYTQGRDASSREDLRARPPGPTRKYPLAVLINPGSASSSEIVAGALRDTHRAVLVGEKSFGKGSVQTILPIDGGREAIRLTTALFHLPSGAIINGKGIEPHIPVTLSADEDRKVAVQRNRLGFMSEEEFADQFGFDPIEDRQLTAAVDALRGVFVLASVGQR